FEGPFTPAGDVRVTDLPGGAAAMTVHHGSYETLSGEYKRIMSWAKDSGRRLGDDPWEGYVKDPKVDGEAVTEVYFPLAYSPERSCTGAEELGRDRGTRPAARWACSRSRSSPSSRPSVTRSASASAGRRRRP